MRLRFVNRLKGRSFLGVPAVFVASVFIPGSGLDAQVPATAEAAYAADDKVRIVFEARVASADMALASGLVATAATLYERLVARSIWDESELAYLHLQWAAALLAQGSTPDAANVISRIPGAQRGDRYRLYRAIADLMESRNGAGAVAAVPPGVDPTQLPPMDRPWFHFLAGVEAEEAGDSEAAEAAYARASGQAQSEMQRSYFQSLVLRQEMRRSPASDGLAAELRGRWEKFRGDATAYPYAREYAVVLANLGRTDEAIEVLNSELRNRDSGYEGREREQLLLMVAMIAGVETERGRAALRELVRTGTDRETMSIALSLLARRVNSNNREEFGYFINQLIGQPEPHPMLGQLLLIRSQLRLRSAAEAREANDIAAAKGYAAEAEEDALRLLERYPGMLQIGSVYQLLAYATLQRTPAQYRVAADYLIQLRDRSDSGRDRARLNRLIGDCYFLNGDFSNAADFYEAARAASAEEGFGLSLFLRLITAEVRAGRLASALDHVDGADFAGSITVEERWRVEWNLAQALRKAGRLEDALERVRLLVGDEDQPSVPAYLDLRLRWLLHFLRLEAGETGEELLASASRLYERVRAFPEGQLGKANARLLLTELRLLEARISIASGASERGLAALGELRTGYPESAAAERSYIVEADFYAANGNYSRAVDRLSELAESHPESPFAPEALFEAARHSQRTGEDGYPAAVRLFDRLAAEYPNSPLLFYARLNQGDLLRAMNEFEGAQIIYENLINRFPEHPNRYLAELARIESLMALARDGATQWEDASLALERLLDLPNLPVDFQVEAGFKYAFALGKQGLTEQAAGAFVSVYTRFLLDNEVAERLGEPGKYWMSRVLLELGKIHERAGNPAEAKRVYSQIIAYNLPGRRLVENRAGPL